MGELGRGTAGEPSGMSESQLSELRNMRVLLEEARLLARDLGSFPARADVWASLLATDNATATANGTAADYAAG